MKKFLLGTVGLLALGLATPASAADLAPRPYSKSPPPMMAVMYDWSGFYMGLNGGWGQNRDCRGDATTGVAFGCHNGSGGTAGGQLGYRWQSGGLVFGLEGQGNWADFRGNNVSLVDPTVAPRSRMDAFGLFTGQIGYALDNALLYAKGGAAVTDTNYDVISTATGALVSTAGNNTNWGAVAGAGLEYGFAPSWSVAVEYDHIFQSSRNLTFSTAAGPLADSFRTGGDTDLVTARVNFRWGGPTIPKY
jgi:outer membrane immunogenic protein